MTGYHKREIRKYEYGTAHKIFEEIQELLDAEEQGIAIMSMVEMADIYGALEGFAKKKYNLDMADIKAMSDVTKRAFESGDRKD